MKLITKFFSTVLLLYTLSMSSLLGYKKFKINDTRENGIETQTKVLETNCDGQNGYIVLEYQGKLVKKDVDSHCLDYEVNQFISVEMKGDFIVLPREMISMSQIIIHLGMVLIAVTIFILAMRKSAPNKA